MITSILFYSIHLFKKKKGMSASVKTLKQWKSIGNYFQHKDSFGLWYLVKSHHETLNFRGLPGGLAVTNLHARAGYMGSIPGLGWSHMPAGNIKLACPHTSSTLLHICSLINIAAEPTTVVGQASLSITISQSLPKLM